MIVVIITKPAFLALNDTKLIILIDQFLSLVEETKVNCNTHEIDQQKKKES